MALLRSAATVGSLTMMSRVLGVLRDTFIAYLVGSGPVAQAFVVAFRIPNLFSTIFAEAAFNTSFVPIFSRRLEGEGLPSARTLAEEVFSVVFAGLLLLTAAAQIAMPWLIHVIAPGYTADPAQFDLSVAMTRIAFPSILFMSLTAILAGMLNSLRLFAAAAAAPILLNILMIAALTAVSLLGWGNSAASGYALVSSMSLAGVAQFLMLAYACRRNGLGLRLHWPRITPDVARLFRLAAPSLVVVGVTQINILVSTMVATGIERAVSYLYYAEKLYQLPLAVIGVALGVVLLPEMSGKLRAGDEAGAIDMQNRALELAMLVTLPATAALTLIPSMLVATIFENGAFSASDTAATSLALMAFAAGLPAYTSYKVLAPGFFSRSDTRTPMLVAFVSVGCNVLGSFTLPSLLGYAGLALSTAIAAWINMVILLAILYRRGHYRLDRQLIRRLPRILLASLVMGASLLLSATAVQDYFTGGNSAALRFAVLAAVLALGLSVYAISCHVFGAMKWQEARKLLRRQ